MEKPEPPRRRAPSLGAVKFLARELSASVRIGLAAPRGWAAETHRAAPGAPAEDLVVLVHGLMATAGVFVPVVRYLRAELGLDVRTFSYWPGASLDGIAARLGRELTAAPGAVRVHLIGHSLGGLAARWYVHEHAHDPRVVQTISVASPFRGVELADAIPERVRALAFPTTPELERLVAGGAAHGSRVPHLSIVAERDQLVTPVAGILPGSPSFVLHDTGHNGALFHPKLYEVLTRELRRRIPRDELA